MADVNLAGWGWYEKCQVPSLTAWCERLMGPSKLVGKRSIGMCLFVCGSWIMGKGWESWIQDLVSFCRCSWLIGVGDLLIEDA